MENKPPLVSIIIPTYNRALIISETINSILSQTYTNWECIIVDDGSTDNTEEIVLAFSKINSSIKYFKRPNHLIKGPNSSRNFGFSKSNGEIINWFDSDDIYLSSALQKIIDAYTENIDVVIAKLEFIDLLTNQKKKESVIKSNKSIEDYFTGKIAFYVCGPFWNRKFLENQHVLFDETIRNLDDWDFNLRMLLQNPNCFFLNEVIIQYRFHNDSLSQEINKFNFIEIQSEIKARQKILKLLKHKNDINQSVISNYCISRYQLLLRQALLKKDSKKYYLLFLTLKLQIQNLKFSKALKTVLGFISYSFFNKGYKLLKP